MLVNNYVLIDVIKKNNNNQSGFEPGKFGMEAERSTISAIVNYGKALPKYT